MGVVNCVLQDSRGFMWFGTQDGLNKYDGYNITVFKTINSIPILFPIILSMLYTKLKMVNSSLAPMVAGLIRII